MTIYDVKPKGKTICALCCNDFISCTLTNVKEINKCGTHMVLLERYGDKTVGEIIENGGKK